MTVETQKDNWDNSVEQTEDKEEDQPDVSDYEIMNYPADITLAGYREQWDKKQLIVPNFQRKYVWDQVRASRLIESFLLGLPVPGIFLYKKRGGKEFLVIDGNQRIHSIVCYFKGKIGEKKFKLKNVNEKWNGKTFDNLADEDKFKLENAVMRATIIQQISPEDNSSIYSIFQRLNTGGVNLNPMEVRMCVDECTLTELFRELNELQDWRHLIQKNKPDNRLRDIELILRVFALSDNGSAYEKPMKSFLNNYIKDNKKRDSVWIDGKRESFTSAVRRAKFLKKDGSPFRLRGGKLNYAALDSILVALMDSRVRDASCLKSAYDLLLENKIYMNATVKDTSDKQEILDRIRLAKEAFRLCD